PVCGRLVIDCRNHVTWQQSRTCSGRIWQRPYDRRMTSSIANLSSYATTYVAVQVFVELFRFLPIHVHSVVITRSCDESAACAIYQCFRVNIAVKIQLQLTKRRLYTRKIKRTGLHFKAKCRPHEPDD